MNHIIFLENMYSEEEQSYQNQEHDQIDFEVHEVNTGAQEKTSIPVNKLQKNGYVLIEGRPCRVVDIQKFKIGKHGHAKAKIAGSDLFTGRRFETMLPSSHDIEVPFVERNEYSLINIDGKNTQLLDLQGNMREDVEILDDDEIGKKIKNAFENNEKEEEIIVTVISCLGNSKIVDFKKIA